MVHYSNSSLRSSSSLCSSSSRSPSVVQSLLVQPPSPSLLSPTLEIFAKVCENAPSPVLPQLASCAACSIVPDMLSNAQSMADYDSFLLCLSIVTSTGSHAPPTSTVGRSSINTIKQGERHL